jgi:hypothetical protein
MEQKAIKMIGEKFTSLEYLELSLRAMKAKDAVAELKKHLPGLRGVIKEVIVGYYSDIKRVIKTVKF